MNTVLNQLFSISFFEFKRPERKFGSLEELKAQIQKDVKDQLQKLSNLLHFGTGLFNIEWRVSKDGKVYLMEVSPRAGGNRLAEMLNYAADVDIIEAEVCKAIGEPIPIVHEPHYNGYYAILVLHNDHPGFFDHL